MKGIFSNGWSACSIGCSFPFLTDITWSVPRSLFSRSLLPIRTWNGLERSIFTSSSRLRAFSPSVTVMGSDGSHATRRGGHKGPCPPFWQWKMSRCISRRPAAATRPRFRNKTRARTYSQRWPSWSVTSSNNNKEGESPLLTVFFRIYFIFSSFCIQFLFK